MHQPLPLALQTSKLPSQRYRHSWISLRCELNQPAATPPRLLVLVQVLVLALVLAPLQLQRQPPLHTHLLQRLLPTTRCKSCSGSCLSLH